ncbi:MAG: ATP-binding protein [Bacteroidales bacterium]|nr:ATP-binding protein [Bacteroidales bacterium]
MKDIIFKRKVYDKLLKWKTESNGKTAVLIEGARRIGKSTLVEQFAKNEYKSYIMIDFANVEPEVNSLIENHISNLNYFFMRLQFIYGVALEEHRSVIIFDEVQKQPFARQAIKYLVKDGRYHYIETGSLISIRQNVQNIVIPSEETRIQMFPMDYEEFRWALGDTATVTLLRQSFANKEALGDVTHRHLMRDFRLYMLVGGMPQAVNEYIATNNLQKVDEAKRQILQLYADDMHKIDKSGKLRSVLRAIPSELYKNANRFQMSTVVDNTSSATRLELLDEMRESMIANIAYHSNDPHVGMRLTADFRRYKMYLSDTGLFVTLAFWDKDFTENIIYQKLLSDKLDANLGYVYENVVAQMLRSAGNELYYYTFPSETRNNYEVDFLLSRGNKLLPIEVKSSGYKSHKSLDAFCTKFSARVSNPVLLYTKDYHREGTVDFLPIYYAPFL